MAPTGTAWNGWPHAAAWNIGTTGSTLSAAVIEKFARLLRVCM